MRASIFYSAAFAAMASAQSSDAAAVTSSVDPHPATLLLTQTDSRGVVTGMFSKATNVGTIPGQPAVVTTQPSVVTSQPAVVTTQPVPADIPAVGTGITTLLLPGTGSMYNSTRTVVVSANNSTTVALVAATSTSMSGSMTTSGSGAATGSNASKSGSATGASSSPGAAANVKVAAGGILGFGALVAAFL